MNPNYAMLQVMDVRLSVWERGTENYDFVTMRGNKIFFVAYPKNHFDSPRDKADGNRASFFSVNED